jgi:membrane-associated phospholipid phosphatase
LFFLLFAAIELACLSWLAPVDVAFIQWLESWRSCRSDYFFFVVKDRPLMCLLIAGGGIVALLFTRHRRAEARRLLLVVLIGSFFCELLKTMLERPRPSVLPSLSVGNSFPSGHVTTAVLVAGTLGFLLARSHCPRWVKWSGVSMLSLLVGITVGQRLYSGHHWLSDIVGSVLLASAWLCFALPRQQLLLVSRRSVAGFAGLLVVYGGFYFFPTVRLALPSALSILGQPVFAIAFGEEKDRGALRGEWGDEFQDPPSLWIYQEEASVEAPLPQAGKYLLKIAVRPLLQSKAFACFPLEITVNQQRVGALLLYRGWREYSLHIDPAWTRAGVNTITFRPGVAFPDNAQDRRTVAFRHLRVFGEKG